MVPIPMDNLKKARPMAVSTTVQVSLEKSGLNKKARPCPAPGRLRLRMQISSSSPNSTGIKTLVVFSIPLDTPRIIINAIRASTIHCQMSDWDGLLTNWVNASEVVFGSVESSEPEKDLKI